MNKADCKLVLKQTIQGLGDQVKSLDIKEILTTAWQHNYSQCLNLVGGETKAQQLITQYGQMVRPGYTHQAATSQPSFYESIGEQLVVGFHNFMTIAGLSLLAIFIFLVIRFLFRFLYDVFNEHRLVYFRIIQPRSDTKQDREREKDIAKDMKEKIARMSQVYRALHKLGERSVIDGLMDLLFKKAKVSFLLHYDQGKVDFIVSTYPEYRKVIEAAIAAQYPDASIEMVKKPNLFKYKYTDVIPLQPVKDPVFPIRVFKQLEDDPLNNILDSIGKVRREDTFSMLLITKPQGDKFNVRAKKFAEALYKKDKRALKRRPLRKKIIFFPKYIIDYLVMGPSEELIKRFHPGAHQGDPFIRMPKAEEDALNVIAEEAGKPAFNSGLLLISSSKAKERPQENLRNVLSAFTVFKDEYNNELDQPEWAADMFGFFFKPLWKMAAKFHLVWFFFKRNIFTVNELTSLFHFPDAVYNRSPIIRWMDYKQLPPPDKVPVLKDENSKYLIDGKIAESYKDGIIHKIFEKSKHRAVGEKELKGDDGSKRKIKALKTFYDGILLGINVYRNRFTPIYFKKKDRTRHHYIIGKSGTGKSAFISFLARQDVWAGNGLAVIDPHGDLVEDILNYIPKDRARDIIYFDAGNDERPMGLNLYEIDDISQADRVVNDATAIFLKMFGPEIFGPRIQEYFKYGSLTLLEDLEEGATLIDVPRLFTDEIFREYKVRKVRNPVVRNFWERTYAAMGDREKEEIIPYFTSKFVSFITNRLIRNIIGQTKSAFRFREVMDEGKILLVNLSKGKIGELNAQLLGMILVTQIYNAAMSRANIPESQRRDFYLYVDEFQNFVTDTFADILSEARKYKLALIMAHQYIAQLESSAGYNIGENKRSSVKDAVFGNVGTMMSFKVGATDAEVLEKEYAPVLSPADIIGISNYKAYIKLNVDNTTSRVFSLDTIWSTNYKNPKVPPILKEYSAKKYGRKREFVEAEIAARIGILDEEDAQPEVKQILEAAAMSQQQTGNEKK